MFAPSYTTPGSEVLTDVIDLAYDKEEVRGSNPRAPTSDLQRNRDSSPPLDPASATILQPKCSVADGMKRV